MWKTVKIIGGIVCLITAVVLGIQQYGKFNPPLEYEPPKSMEEARYQKKMIEDAFKRGIDRLGLTREQREGLGKWLKWNSKGKTVDEKRAHLRELKELLDDDQLKEFNALRRERSQRLKDLRKENTNRFREMLGDADYEKNKADMKKRSALRKQRIQEQKDANK